MAAASIIVPHDETLPRLNRFEAHVRRCGVLEAARYLRLTGRDDAADELFGVLDDLVPVPQEGLQ